MLIRCESCGKMFDYDKQDGQCPACGAFAARPAAAAAEPDLPAAERAPDMGIGGVRGALHRPAAVRTANRRGGGLLWLRVLLAALGLVFFGLAAVAYPANPGPEPVPVTGVSAAAGDTVLLAGRTMTFSRPQRLTGRTAGLPAGWQLYRVWVSAPELEDWDSRVDGAVSLRAGGGYWEMLDDYELERLWPELAEEMVSAYDLSGWEALDGWVYLAGPEDPEAALCLEDQILDEDYDPHTRTVTTLELNWEEADEA